ncbi:MAG: RNA methyltransferase [Endomicrobium sp.]|nr:RNA methyltransferase [Endomicrobium sp.]
MVLENVQDPGNLGAIVRSADAFGAKAIFISKKSTDIYSDKTIRATMGSLFHLPVLNNVDIKELIILMKRKKITIFATSLNSKKYLNELHCSTKIAFIIGNESNGVKIETEKLANTSFKIPMYGKAESLNVAVAASIIMYEVTKNKQYMQI